MAKKKKTPLLDRALRKASEDNEERLRKKAQMLMSVPNSISELKGILGADLMPSCPPPLEYIKIPIVGSRTPEQLSNAISDLLCWFQGVEFATTEEKSYKLEMARNGINAIRDIHHYIKTPMK